MELSEFRNDHDFWPAHEFPAKTGNTSSRLIKSRSLSVFSPKRTIIECLWDQIYQGCKSSARPGPAEILGRSCPILFLSVFLKGFLKKIWTLLLTHFKLSIVLSKSGGISAKSSRNIGKKRPSPQKFWAWTARPSPLEFAGRNGPAQFVKPEINNPEIYIIDLTEFRNHHIFWPVKNFLVNLKILSRS